MPDAETIDELREISKGTPHDRILRLESAITAIKRRIDRLEGKVESLLQWKSGGDTE